jgi:mannonate dehydratase
MYLGEQLSDLSDRRLTLSAQLGVEHVAVHSPQAAGVVRPDGTWDAAALRGVRERLAGFGIALDVLGLDVEALWPAMLRDPPDVSEYEAMLARIEQNVHAAAEAGVPCLKWRVQPLGVLRTGRSPGRGGARNSRFDARAWTDHSLTEMGRVSSDQMWAAIGRFLERIVPVAEACGVRLACHPQDAPLPPEGLRGIPHVLSSVAALDRLLATCESPYHGLNFCQGTVAEMCKEPATEVLDAIRRFGARRKIFMVHFRNIRGGFLAFDEVYPDEGDVDMLAAVRAYLAAGVDCMLCPDHVPQSDADPGGERQFSYCLGYTKALLQAARQAARI